MRRSLRAILGLALIAAFVGIIFYARETSRRAAVAREKTAALQYESALEFMSSGQSQEARALLEALVSNTPDAAVAPQAHLILSQPPLKVFHIKSRGSLTREAFYLRESLADGTLTTEQLDKSYEKYLVGRQTLVNEQVALVRELMKENRLKVIFQEEFVDSNIAEARELIEQVRRSKQSTLEKRKKAIEEHPELGRTLALADVLRKRRTYSLEFLLPMGCAGNLIWSDELDDVLPLESRSYTGTSPAEIDYYQSEQREDDIAKRLLAAGPVVIIVFDGKRDLRDNLRKLSLNIDYVVYDTPTYRKLAE